MSDSCVARSGGPAVTDTGRALIVRGDAAHIPLPDNSVDLIVTSPPYYALRAYTDNGGEHYPGQIGSEATPAEYIDALIDCTREWIRVLRPTGSMFVDLGDKYDSGTRTPRHNGGDRMGDGRTTQPWNTDRGQRTSVGRPKSLLLLPERYRIACMDQLGLTVRAVIVWSKPNGLPESVTDRVRRSHEDWVHLTKRSRYYSSIDEIRENYSPNKPWGSGLKSGLKIGAATAVIRGTSAEVGGDDDHKRSVSVHRHRRTRPRPPTRRHDHHRSSRNRPLVPADPRETLAGGTPP